MKNEKEKKFSMKNSDLISDYDKSESKIKLSIIPKFNKFNNKNIMLNNVEEEIS